MDIWGEDQHHVLRLDRDVQENVLHVQIKILNLTKQFEQKLLVLEQRLASYQKSNQEFENLHKLLTTDIPNLWNRLQTLSNDIQSNQDNSSSKFVNFEARLHSLQSYEKKSRICRKNLQQ